MIEYYLTERLEEWGHNAVIDKYFHHNAWNFEGSKILIGDLGSIYITTSDLVFKLEYWKRDSLMNNNYIAGAYFEFSDPDLFEKIDVFLRNNLSIRLQDLGDAEFKAALDDDLNVTILFSGRI